MKDKKILKKNYERQGNFEKNYERQGKFEKILIMKDN